MEDESSVYHIVGVWELCWKILGIMMGQKNQELFLNFDAISGHNWHKMNFQIKIL